MKKLTMSLIILLACVILNGCSHSSANNVQVTDQMNQTISDYILYHNHQIYQNKKGDKAFEVHKIYGATKQKNGVDKVYLEVFFEVYSRSKKEMIAGALNPALVTLKQENGKFQVTDYQVPADGNLWVSSVKKMFPRKEADEAIREARGNHSELKKQMKAKIDAWLAVK